MNVLKGNENQPKAKGYEPAPHGNTACCVKDAEAKAIGEKGCGCDCGCGTEADQAKNHTASCCG
jgi:hypothetical protein